MFPKINNPTSRSNEIDWLFHPDGAEMSDFTPVPWNDWGNTYFNLNGRPMAKYVGGVADGEAVFFHSNALGSTSRMTWYNEDVVQKEIFYPYGQRWWASVTNKDERFASMETRQGLLLSLRRVALRATKYHARSKSERGN